MSPGIIPAEMHCARSEKQTSENCASRGDSLQHPNVNL